VARQPSQRLLSAAAPLAAALSLGPLPGCGGSPPPTPSASSSANAGSEVLVPAAAGQPSLLAFSRTAAFRHQSIPAGLSGLTGLAEQGGFGLTATEDPTQFDDAFLAGFAAVVFLSTSGDVLDATQQAAFERYIAAGHGYVGVHAASDCEYDWPWYGGLVGAYFTGHSDVVPATVELEPVTHGSLIGLPSPWSRADEWYGFRANPREHVTVLLTVDESTFDPGTGAMGADHPVAWYHAYQGGRAFYTALGHTAESYSEPAFLAHLAGGLEWALGITR
jgi:cytochrome c